MEKSNHSSRALLTIAIAFLGVLLPSPRAWAQG
jgi:hypothetical protein